MGVDVGPREARAVHRIPRFYPIRLVPRPHPTRPVPRPPGLAGAAAARPGRCHGGAFTLAAIAALTAAVPAQPRQATGHSRGSADNQRPGMTCLTGTNLRSVAGEAYLPAWKSQRDDAVRGFSR